MASKSASRVNADDVCFEKGTFIARVIESFIERFSIKADSPSAVPPRRNKKGWEGVKRIMKN